VLLTWEDLTVDIHLTTRVDDKDSAVGEATDAAKAGLSAVMLTSSDADNAKLVARLRSKKEDHAVKLDRQDVVWNGKDFKVSVKPLELPAKATEIAL
jgi:hypothetical protein